MDKMVFDNAVIVFGEGSERIELPGQVMVEATLDKNRETMGSMSFPRIGAVSGEMVIDTIGEEPRERKPLSRQESFGSYLRKGKKW